MKVQYDFVEHNVDNEAPFVGAVIYAKRDGKPHKKEVGKLMREVIEQELNEGIIFKGDWSSQGLEFLKILEYVKKYNLKVCIYTDHNLDVFKTIIGMTSYEKVNKERIADEEIQNNISMYSFMGGMLIDYYIESDYWIVCGKKDKQVYQINKPKENENEEIKNNI